MASISSQNTLAALRQIGACRGANQLQNRLQHEKQTFPQTGRAEIGSANQGRPRRGAAASRRRHIRGSQHLPELYVHVFLDGGDEALGGRKEQSVHLYALRKPHAHGGGRKDFRAGGSVSGGW